MNVKSRARIGGWLLVNLLLLGLASPALGQEAGARTRGQMESRQQLEARVRQLFNQRIRADLGLTKEQFSEVETRLQPFQQERRDLARRERATRLRIQAVLQDVGRDECEADELLAEMIKLREEELSLFKREMEALGDQMTSEQRLRFIVYRDQLNQRLQGARGRALGGGPPGGVPPGGPDPAGGPPGDSMGSGTPWGD